MDPEIQRELEEQFREMIAMLSQTNATMAGTVKAMSDASSSIAGVTTSSKNATSAQNANNQATSNNTGGQTRLSEAQQKAIKVQEDFSNSLENAGKKVQDAIGGLVGSFGSLTKSMMDGKGGFSEYNSAITQAGDAVAGLAKDVPVLGAAFGLATKATVGLATVTLTLVDQIQGFRDGLAKTVGVTGLTTTELTNLSKNAGFTGEKMAKLQTITSGISGNLLVLGNTAGQGAAKFLEVADVGEKTRKQFSKLGISFTEITELQAKYIQQQSISGNATELQAKSAAKVREESIKYALELNKLTTMTGKNADALIQEQAAVKLDEGEQAAILAENYKILKLEKSENKADREEAARLKADQKTRAEFTSEITSRLGSKEALQVQKAIRTGVIDSDTRSLMMKGITPEMLKEMMRKKDGASEFINMFAEASGKAAARMPGLQFADAATRELFFGSAEAVQNMNKAGAGKDYVAQKAAADKDQEEAVNKPDPAADKYAANQEAQIKVGQAIQTALEKQVPEVTTAMLEVAKKVPEAIEALTKLLENTGGITGMAAGTLAIGGAAVGAGIYGLAKGAKALGGLSGAAGAGAAGAGAAGAGAAGAGAAARRAAAMAEGRAARAGTPYGSPAPKVSTLSKLKGATKGLGGLAKGFLGKVALPITAAMAAYDAYKGFTADADASLGDKLKNAGSSMLNGLSFGLLGSNSEEITARANVKANTALTKATGHPLQKTSTAGETLADVKNRELREKRDALLADQELRETFNNSMVVGTNTFKTLNTRVSESSNMLKIMTTSMSDFIFALTGKRPEEDSPSPSPTQNGADVRSTYKGDLGNVLETIKKNESSGDYNAQSKTSSASGAYQFIDSTWQASVKKYGTAADQKYKRAKDAPPEVQDRIAAASIQEILDKNNGDLRAVSNTWFTGNAAGKMSAAALRANNGLTAEDVYNKKFAPTYAKIAASAPPVTTAPPVSSAIGAVNQFTEGLNAASDKLISTKPQNVTLGTGVDLSGVDSNLLSKFFTAAQEFGQPVNINSAYRTDQYQAELFVRNSLGERGIYTPARPKNTTTINYRGKQYTVKGSGIGSAHGRGLALDMSTSNNYAFDPILSKYGLERPHLPDDPPHVELKAAKGGFFNGPKSGYPVELHGGEMVAPLDMNSALAKLAKTPATQAEENESTASLASAKEVSSGVEKLAASNMDFMRLLSDKLDIMIDSMVDVSSNTKKMMKNSRV